MCEISIDSQEGKAPFDADCSDQRINSRELNPLLAAYGEELRGEYVVVTRGDDQRQLPELSDKPILRRARREPLQELLQYNTREHYVAVGESLPKVRRVSALDWLVATKRQGPHRCIDEDQRSAPSRLVVVAVVPFQKPEKRDDLLLRPAIKELPQGKGDGVFFRLGSARGEHLVEQFGIQRKVRCHV